MKIRSLAGTAIALCLLAAVPAFPQNPAQAPGNSTKEKVMHAKGTFEVKVAPAEDAALTAESMGRFEVDKQLHGDFEGTSKGFMLTAGNANTGTAGYVALEHMTGTLGGKKGSFILQHLGQMQGGAFDMTIRVVPGTGTDDLKGIAGTMKIIIEGGKHSYEFDYTLDGAQ